MVHSASTVQEIVPVIDAVLLPFIAPVARLSPPLPSHASSCGLSPDAAVTHMFLLEFVKAVGGRAAAMIDAAQSTHFSGTEDW